jgi:L-asparaginase
VDVKQVLIIHTGGTFGMISEKGEYALKPTGSAQELVNQVPELKKIANIEIISPFSIDSADINIHHFSWLAETIVEHKDDFDGFIIIHGTDTLAYTASALSFMLLHFSKPVIITGAQRPLDKIRTDARNNLINAVEMAVSGIPEVGIFFGNRLFRGNRTTKISTWKYEAFDSPNFSPLAEVGLDITISDHIHKGDQQFEPFFSFEPSVFVIKSFPGLKSDHIRPLLNDEFKAFIIESYGGGTIPLEDSTLIEFIEEAIGQGKIVSVNTQCSHGSVFLDVYQSSKELQRVGALSCVDMTMEASLMKMMYLLAKYQGEQDTIKTLFERDLAGELSQEQHHHFAESEL